MLMVLVPALKVRLVVVVTVQSSPTLMVALPRFNERTLVFDELKSTPTVQVTGSKFSVPAVKTVLELELPLVVMVQAPPTPLNVREAKVLPFKLMVCPDVVAVKLVAPQRLLPRLPTPEAATATLPLMLCVALGPLLKVTVPVSGPSMVMLR